MTTAYSINARFVRFLIEEAGAPVNERSPCGGRTALHFCGIGGETETMAVPLEAGADIEARYDHGGTPLLSCARYCLSAPTQLLLERGASADVVDSKGLTPLISACAERGWFSDNYRWPVFQELLRRSSTQTRRVVIPSDGHSAADELAWRLQRDGPPAYDRARRTQERYRWALAELLASGASARPQFATVVLPIAAALSTRQETELAERRSERRRWRAH